MSITLMYAHASAQKTLHLRAASSPVSTDLDGNSHDPYRRTVMPPTRSNVAAAGPSSYTPGWAPRARFTCPVGPLWLGFPRQEGIGPMSERTFAARVASSRIRTPAAAS